jgi:phage terminase small subunit
MSLTPKQQRFVQEYLIDLNATQAAIRAGYSPRTAAEQGARLLTNVKISAAIAAAMQSRQQRTEITADRVLKELARVALLDPRGFFDSDGKLKKVTDLTEDQAAALAGMESLEYFEGSGRDREQVGWTRKIKWWPKVEALRLLMQHMGMLVKKMEVSGPDGGPIETKGPTDVFRRIDELVTRFSGEQSQSESDSPGDSVRKPLDT